MASPFNILHSHFCAQDRKTGATWRLQKVRVFFTFFYQNSIFSLSFPFQKKEISSKGAGVSLPCQNPSFWNVLFVKQWEIFSVLTSFLMRRVFISPLSHIQLGSQSNQWTPAVLCLESMCIYYYFRLWNCPWCWNHGGACKVVVLSF